MKDCGHITICDPGSDKPVSVTKTVQCKHCGSHFLYGPGYTKDRGFCYRCNGPICGAKCLECIPQEAMIEIMEGTRNPTAVSVGGLWLPGSD